MNALLFGVVNLLDSCRHFHVVHLDQVPCNGKPRRAGTHYKKICSLFLSMVFTPLFSHRLRFLAGIHFKEIEFRLLLNKVAEMDKDKQRKNKEKTILNLKLWYHNNQ